MEESTGGESPEQDGDDRFKAKVAESGEELDRSGGLAVVGDARARRRSKRATSGLAAATGARAPASSGQNDGEERRGCQRARAPVQRGKGTPGSCWSSSSAAIAGRRGGIERHGRRPPGVGDRVRGDLAPLCVWVAVREEEREMSERREERGDLLSLVRCM